VKFQVDAQNDISEFESWLLDAIVRDRLIDAVLNDAPMATDDPNRLADVWREEDIHGLIEGRKPNSCGAAAFPWQETVRLRRAAVVWNQLNALP
jgi:hypothetical protein